MAGHRTRAPGWPLCEFGHRLISPPWASAAVGRRLARLGAQRRLWCRGCHAGEAGDDSGGGQGVEFHSPLGLGVDVGLVAERRLGPCRVPCAWSVAGPTIVGWAARDTCFLWVVFFSVSRASLLEAGRDTPYKPGTMRLWVRGHSIVWQPARQAANAVSSLFSSAGVPGYLRESELFGLGSRNLSPGA